VVVCWIKSVVVDCWAVCMSVVVIRFVAVVTLGPKSTVRVLASWVETLTIVTVEAGRVVMIVISTGGGVVGFVVNVTFERSTTGY
jgi:hypothetical protein